MIKKPYFGYYYFGAPWWHWVLARIFGKRIEGDYYECKLVAYRWRDTLYVTSVEFVDQGRQASAEDQRP
jgi:hypothetical protein